MIDVCKVVLYLEITVKGKMPVPISQLHSCPESLKGEELVKGFADTRSFKNHVHCYSLAPLQ
jgi:hypothetical protein